MIKSMISNPSEYRLFKEAQIDDYNKKVVLAPDKGLLGGIKEKLFGKSIDKTNEQPINNTQIIYNINQSQNTANNFNPIPPSFCTYCGTKLQVNWVFCQNCGAPVKK